MSFKTASAVLRGKWLISPDWAADHLPLIASLIKGDNRFQFERKGISDDYSSGQNSDNDKAAPVQAVATGVYRTYGWTDLTRVPQGSISLIDINGPILKYGDMCSYGSLDYIEAIQNADRSPNISSIIISIDSPGGQVDGTATLADVIRNTSKPVIAHVNDGMMCSAAMWIGSAADEIYASQPTDLIGSIGVYCTLYDWKSYFEKEGLPIHDIYAPESTEKNKDAKEALKGNYDGIQAELSVIAQRFINTIKENRGEKAIANSEKWNKGQHMFAQDAINAGLIDGIKSIEEVAEIAGYKKDKRKSSNNNNMFGNKFSKLSALKGKASSDVTAEELTAVNEQLHAEGIENFSVVADASLQSSVDRIAELENQLTAANTAKDAAVAAQQKAEQDLAAEKSKPGAAASGNKKEGTDAIEDEKEVLLPVEAEARAAYARIHGTQK